MESTFAVEGVLDAGAMQQVDGWELTLESQSFLISRSTITCLPIRRSGGRSPTTSISIRCKSHKLYVAARRGDFYAAMGRFVTPFGRFYFPNYRNNFDDSPFIRSEAILFRETGLLLQWDPAFGFFNAAVTNGGFQQDANSSKALVAARESISRGMRWEQRPNGKTAMQRNAKSIQQPCRSRCDDSPRPMDVVGRGDLRSIRLTATGYSA